MASDSQKAMPIVAVPEPVLGSPCQDVSEEEFNDDLQLLIDRMFVTMKEANGVGLAANQVGVSRRLFVVDITHDQPDVRPFEVINPQVIEQKGETTYDEGCLSIPGFYHEMKRSAEITIEYVDRDKKSQRLEAKGFLAIVLQHELAHINGKTIISHLSPMKQSMIIKKVQKQIRHRE